MLLEPTFIDDPFFDRKTFMLKEGASNELIEEYNEWIEAMNLEILLTSDPEFVC